MPSKSETGHAINVANFETLISFATGYAAKYNPSKAAIKLPALISQHLAAKASLNNVTATSTAFINATNARQVIFTPVKPLATRVVNALASSDTTKETIADARTIVRKVQGSRKGKSASTPPQEPGTDKQVSASQLSYDSQVSNFKKIIELVASEPGYTPNETDLQVTALNAFAADMDTNNTAVINAATTLSNARIDRNRLLYDEKAGLYTTAMEVKKYVKSVFNASSPEYKQVSKIKFTKTGK